MDKPFKTIAEQVDLLRERGVETSDDTPALLLREGYYSIVNGYKEPFIDAAASKEAGDDRYKPGTTFGDLYGIFSFDRALRDLTFPWLIRAEATVRTAVPYCFSEAHRETEDYLLQSSYCTRAEYVAFGRNGDEYASEVSGLTGILGRRARNSSAEFVAHYREAHGGVPLWVLANDLTFGNLEHFFNLMKPGERVAVCKAIATSTGRLGDKRLGYFDEGTAQVGIEVLVRFRNICAHDERLYCARVGGRKDVNYSKMVWMLERYLSRAEFTRFLVGLVDLLKWQDERGGLVAEVLEGIGYSELSAEIMRRYPASEKAEE